MVSKVENYELLFKDLLNGSNMIIKILFHYSTDKVSMEQF